MDIGEEEDGGEKAEVSGVLIEVWPELDGPGEDDPRGEEDVSCT